MRVVPTVSWPVTLRGPLPGSQLLGNLLSVRGARSYPTLSGRLWRPPPVQWRDAPAKVSGMRRPSGRPWPVAGKRTGLGQRVRGSAGAEPRTPGAAWPRASWNAPRAGAPTANCEAVVRGNRDAGTGGRAGWLVRGRRSTGQPGRHSRRVRQALLVCGPQEAGARDTCARPGCCGRGPPDALEPCRARRGTHLGWGCQCSVITARYCPASLSS